MNTIPLTRGLFALVDDEDFAGLMRYKWTATNPKTGPVYAVRSLRLKTRRQIRMHRCILMLPIKTGVDHRNGDGLDNRKENLRLASQSQNMANSKKYLSAKTSKYKGVTFHKDTGKWNAKIGVNYKTIHLGLFLSPEEAAKAYDAAALRYFGEFARINFQEAL